MEQQNVRIVRKKKKVIFQKTQVVWLEENNKMRKTRDLVKKIRDTKGTFYAKMGSIKDGNGMAESPVPPLSF